MVQVQGQEVLTLLLLLLLLEVLLHLTGGGAAGPRQDRVLPLRPGVRGGGVWGQVWGDGRVKGGGAGVKTCTDLEAK